MSEKYTATRIVAAGALGVTMLAGCGSGETSSNQVDTATPPSVTHSEAPSTSAPNPEVSPSALPWEIASGKGKVNICRGVVVLQVPEGFRTVANPIVDPTSKQILFIEDFSEAGITVDTERDSAQPAGWHDLHGNPKTPAEISCKEQVVYTHHVTEPGNNGAYVVTASPKEFSGTTRLDIHAIQGAEGIVDHDFGLEGEVAMTERLEQLAQLHQ